LISFSKYIIITKYKITKYIIITKYKIDIS